MKPKQQRNKNCLLVLLTLTLILPLSYIRPKSIQAERIEYVPYEFTEPLLYDETAPNGIADPEAAHALLSGLAPVLSVEDFADGYGTFVLVATFTNTTNYPMQNYSFWGTIRSNNEQIYGTFSDYILMPGDSQRIGLQWNVDPDNLELILQSPDDFVVDAMTVTLYERPDYVASIGYDGVEGVVTDIEAYPTTPLTTEHLMNLPDIKVFFIDPIDGWVEYYIENHGENPITSFEMNYQDGDYYSLRLQHYETILPGESSPDLFLNHDGPDPDIDLIKPMSMEISFYVNDQETTVRYDFGPAMYRNFDDEEPDTYAWEEDYWAEYENPFGEPAGFEFPDSLVTKNDQVEDMEMVLSILATLRPSFSVEMTESGEANKIIKVTFTNTTPYALDFADFSGKIISSNKPLRFFLDGYILLPNETHTQMVWDIYEGDMNDMESSHDFELSQLTISLLDAPDHVSFLTYDVKLDRIPYAHGYDYYEWTNEALIDINLYEYEIFDQGDGQYSYVIHNYSDQPIGFIEMTTKTAENNLLRMQTFTPLQPGMSSEASWLYPTDAYFNPYSLEPLSLLVTFTDLEKETLITYDYSLDMYKREVYDFYE